MAVDDGDVPVDDVGESGALGLEDGGEIAEGLASLVGAGVADDLALGVDAVLAADVDDLGRCLDDHGLAEGRVVVEPFGVDVSHGHRPISTSPAGPAGAPCRRYGAAPRARNSAQSLLP